MGSLSFAEQELKLLVTQTLCIFNKNFKGERAPWQLLVKKNAAISTLIPKIKEKAKKILSHYGLSLSDAVNIFLTQVVLENGIPFKIRIPNETTVKALEEVKKGET